MAAPDVHRLTEALYRNLGDGFTHDDEAMEWHLRQFLDAMVAHSLGSLVDLVEPETGDPWAPAMDIDTVALAHIRWLGQFVGVNVSRTLSEAGQRSIVQQRRGWERGTPATMRAAIADQLTGTKTVYFVERDTSPYHFGVRTLRRETPQAQATKTSPTFTRATIAYNQRAVSIASGTPRYEFGRFHNLLTPNQSNIETDTTGWNGSSSTVARSTSRSWEGGASLSITPTTAGTNASALTPSGTLGVPVLPNTPYTLSAYVRADPRITPTVAVLIAFWDGAGTLLTSGVTSPTVNPNDTTWSRVSSSVTSPANAAFARAQLRVNTPNLDHVTYWDGIQLEQNATVSEWRLGSTGHSITIEESTTNLLTVNQSDGGEDGTTTGWATSGTNTIASSLTRAKQGTRSILATYQNDLRLASMTPPTLTAAPHTVSFWVYVPASWDGGRILVTDDGTFAGGTVSFGLSDATKRDQWQRVTTSITPVASDLVGVLVFRAESSPTPTAGQAVYIDAVQLEAKGYSTTWQIGGTARAAEYARTSGTGVVSQSAGTFECWFYMLNSAVPRSTSPRLVSFRTATEVANSGMVLYVNTTDRISALYGTSAGGTQTIAGSPIALNTWYHAAVAWDSTGARLYQDGVLIGSSTTPPGGWTATDVTFGASSAGGAQFNGFIDDIRLSNVARSGTDIAATYSSGAPATWDRNVTYLLPVDSSLAATGATDDTAPVIAAIDANKPAGLQYTYTVIESIAIDDLSGTIDSRTGTIDDQTT